MAVPKSKYIKSKYIKSKYIKSKYILMYKLLYKIRMYPYNIKINHSLSKLTVYINNYNMYLNLLLKQKLKNCHYNSVDIMYLKKKNYTNCKYYHLKNKLRYIYKLI